MKKLALLFALLLLAAPPIASGQTGDTTPPMLDPIGTGISPVAIDVTAGSQVVTVTLHVTDDLAGMQQAYIQFIGPAGIQYRYSYDFFLTSGDALDGTWSADITFPQFIENGDWKIGYIGLTDLVGNNAYLDTATLDAMGVPTTLSVLSNEDLTPPQLVSYTVDPEAFKLDPAAIDTSAASVEVKVRLHMTDDVSGADPYGGGGGGAYFSLHFVSPVPSSFSRSCSYPTLVSGTPNDGVWESSCSFPQYAQAGEWLLGGFAFPDAAGNTFWVSPGDPALDGFLTTITLTSTPSDITPPEVSAFSFSPTFIDTSLSAQSITGTASVTDDLSGFSHVHMSFVSPSGSQNRYLYLWRTVSGDPLNGVFDGQAEFPRFSEAGTWHASYAYYADLAGNFRYYGSTAEIAAVGWPTVLNVVRPSLESDGTIPPEGGTVVDATFGDRATLTLPPGAVSEPTEVAIDVQESPLTFPMPAGFNAPGTYYVNVSFSPEPAMPFPPPGATVVLPLVNPMIPGTSLTLYSVDAKSGLLVPAESVLGGPVVGTVGPDGMSATFSGVAHFSMVVGLLADVEPPVVTPPADITVTATESGGARGSASPELAAFLAGGTATDNVDLSPARLPPQVGGADADNNTLFPIGTTTVTFGFKDTAGNIGAATVRVTVISSNTPPIANAGPDQTVTAGRTVALNGALSSDVDGHALTYAWTLLSRPAGSVAALSNASVVNPTFVADKVGTYVVQLIVNDGFVNSIPDTVSVTVVLPSPVLRARAAGRQVQLSWTSVSGAAGYAVYRGSAAGGPYVKISQVPGTQLMYLEQNLTVGATYFWVVKTTAAGGDESGPSNEVMARIAGR